MKYVHLLLHSSLKFNKPLFMLINDEKNGLDAENHLFVTPFKEVYDECIRCYDNIVFDKRRGLELVNYYGEIADWVFIHALNLSYAEVAKINKKTARKIIWRTWGHDIKEYWGVTDPLRVVKRFMLNLLRVPNVRRFYGIGVAFKYDKVLLESLFGKVKTFILPYRDSGFDYTTLTKDDHGGTVRILVGHSGHKTSNHLQMLHSLSRFSEQPIKICLVLSYGDNEHIKAVKKLAYELYPAEKLEIIEDLMTFEEYMQFLYNIDIAVLDIKGSAALGNFMKLIYMKKKLYVKRDGLMAYALNGEGIDHGYTDELSTISFDEFIRPMSTPEAAARFTARFDDKDYPQKQWRSLLSDLKKESEIHG